MATIMSHNVSDIRILTDSITLMSYEHCFQIFRANSPGIKMASHPQIGNTIPPSTSKIIILTNHLKSKSQTHSFQAMATPAVHPILVSITIRGSDPQIPSTAIIQTSERTLEEVQQAVWEIHEFRMFGHQPLVAAVDGSGITFKIKWATEGVQDTEITTSRELGLGLDMMQVRGWKDHLMAQV
jgi:hypothetical protein